MSEPLHIGLIMQGGAGWVGGSEYIKNLAHALAAVCREEPGACEVSLITAQPLDASWRAELPSLRSVIKLPQKRGGLLGKLFKSGTSALAAAIRQHRIGFAYPLTYDNEYNIGVTLPIGSALAPARWAGWIPDFQHRDLPQLFGEREIAKRDRGIGLLARDARTIVFSSESAANAFPRFFPDATSRAEVLRFCTSPTPAWFEGDALAVQQRYHLPDRFFLVSNQLWQHKNHLLVIDALAELARSGVKPHVIFTGQPSDFRDRNFLNVVLQRLHTSGVAPQVSMLGLIPREDQIQLMRRSLAVVQPSLYEGWSTVVEDARLLGKTVLLSDIDVHVEQAPPGAQYFERSSAPSLAAAMAEAWKCASPGPDFTREAEARAAATRAQLAFGRRFLEIARQA